ncbi:MAG TPA: helix-turn-helix domain-containing protein [Candidatus Binataceae bacterium]|nr:helix-turn-helix domain-containing protein [Candidatus Binataceae bacterium]
MAAGRVSEEAVGSGGESKTDGVGATPQPEPSKAGAEAEPSLGKTLVAAREKRGLSRSEIVAQTRIPAHYVQMMESSDYALISDQLYLLPFLRRYASFLGLDGEEIAMRFVREVQRAEGAPPVRMSEPLMLADDKRSPWPRVMAAAAVLATIVVLYYLAAKRHRAAFPPPAMAPAAQVPVTAPAAPLASAPEAPAAPAPAMPMTAAPAPPQDAASKFSNANAVARPVAPPAPSGAARASRSAAAPQPADSSD